MQQHQQQQHQLLTPKRQWRSLFSPGLVSRQRSLNASSGNDDDGATTTQETSSPDSPLRPLPPPPPPVTTSSSSAAAGISLPSLGDDDPARELARYWPRPPQAMTAWRERAAARSTTSVVNLSALMHAMHKRKCSLSKHRVTAVTLFVLLMVSCPDMADAQVVALAVQYLDRYMVAACSSNNNNNNYFHIAAACMALALKWERVDAGLDLVNARAFNRLLELFQGGGVLTLSALGRLEHEVCMHLEFDMWTCTPAEWLCLVRDAGPMAVRTDGDATTFPPLCWLRREPCAPGADPLPRLEETTAALARLPLEEQLLLHALRLPELVGWSPVRLGAACLVAAGRCGPARCEAARMCTTTSSSSCGASFKTMLEAVRAHRATSKDATALVGLLQRQQRMSGVHARLPPPPSL